MLVAKQGRMMTRIRFQNNTRGGEPSRSRLRSRTRAPVAVVVARQSQNAHKSQHSHKSQTSPAVHPVRVRRAAELSQSIYDVKSTSPSPSSSSCPADHLTTTDPGSAFFQSQLAFLGTIDGSQHRDTARRRHALACVYATPEDHTIYVTIRGTVPSSLPDAIDIRYATHALSDGTRAHVHRGFLAQFNAIEPVIATFGARMLDLSRSLGSDPDAAADVSFVRACGLRDVLSRAHARAHVDADALRIVLCGHSMGGAVAMLAAERLASFVSKVTSIRVEMVAITFGCPRFANEGLFATLRAARVSCLNVELNADPVPLFPMGPSFAPLPARLTLAAPPNPASCCDSSFAEKHGVHGALDAYDTDDDVMMTVVELRGLFLSH